MVIVKRILLSIVIGLIAYEITKVLLDGGIAIPATTPEISLMLLFMATSFASLMAATSPLPGGASRGADADDRELGTVKWFNVRKGYGFITRDQGEDVFVHFRNIEGKGKRAINEGERVSFIVTTGDKGPQADKVIPA
jgi:CspA family cold shock protein